MKEPWWKLSDLAILTIHNKGISLQNFLLTTVAIEPLNRVNLVRSKEVALTLQETKKQGKDLHWPHRVKRRARRTRSFSTLNKTSSVTLPTWTSRSKILSRYRPTKNRRPKKRLSCKTSTLRQGYGWTTLTNSTKEFKTKRKPFQKWMMTAPSDNARTSTRMHFILEIS
jgi:hypothetical protein